jgi:hypothetical protein
VAGGGAANAAAAGGAAGAAGAAPDGTLAAASELEEDAAKKLSQQTCVLRARARCDTWRLRLGRSPARFLFPFPSLRAAAVRLRAPPAPQRRSASLHGHRTQHLRPRTHTARSAARSARAPRGAGNTHRTRRTPVPCPILRIASALSRLARRRARPAATRSFKLAAKEALMDGMRADLVAAKRQVALAEKEAETAQRQLQQREAEIASTHRSLLKLDDVKCVAARAWRRTLRVCANER